MIDNFGEETYIEIASDFVSYSDCLEVVELLYDDNKDDVHLNLSINSKEEFVSILEDNKCFSSIEIKNAYNFAVRLTVSYLGGLEKGALIAFAQEHHDSNFSLV